MVILILKVDNVLRHVLKVHFLTLIITDNADHIVYLHYLAKISQIHVSQVVKQDSPMKEHDNVFKFVQVDIMAMLAFVLNINVH